MLDHTYLCKIDFRLMLMVSCLILYNLRIKGFKGKQKSLIEGVTYIHLIGMSVIDGLR